MTGFLAQLPRSGSTPLLGGHARQGRRGRRAWPAQSVVLAEAEPASAPAPAGEEASSSGGGGAGLLARPKLPQLIWRAPPSDRTMESKDRQQAERMEAAHARFDASRARDDRRGGGGGGGNGSGYAAVRPNRYEGRGGRGPGAAAPAGEAGARPGAEPGARAPGAANGRGAGREAAGGKWGGRGDERGESCPASACARAVRPSCPGNMAF